MDPAAAHERLEEMSLVDVREPWEWDAGRIEGALHVPLEQLPFRVSELPRGRPLLVICRSGQRSALAAEFLGAQGFEAHNLDGGLKAWTGVGLPFEGRVV